ncbi:hypothetical protein ACHQM5_016440 [Ranunculus cassubicifolius]
MLSIKFQSSISASTHFGYPANQCKSPRMAVKMQAAAVNSCPANLYEVLRLKRPASNAQIKAAYRSLVKQFHPDTNKSGNDQDFIEIHKAYATLSDPITRARYDMNLALSQPGGLCKNPHFTSYHQTKRWETDQCW